MNAGACFHCGEPLPATPVTVALDGAERAMCCTGCAAAGAWIRDAGLADYYRLRSSQARKADDGALDFSAWDRADLLAEHARRDGDDSAITVLVEGIRCAACAWLIGRALGEIPGVVEAEANAVTGRLHLRWRQATTPLSRLLERLAALGYRPHLATGEATEAARKAERRDLIKRLAIAGIGAFQAMMFAEALYLDVDHTMPAATRDFFRWLTFLVATPVVFYAGWPFLAGMRRELRLRRFGMDTLIATSVLLAYLASLAETLRGGAHVWYDAAVMFVLFLLLARFLERMARQQAQSAVDALARARPALAWRESGGGALAQVPLHVLAAGDVVRVRAGESVPADGVLIDAAAELDEALLTGESRPVARHPGDAVYAGSLAVAQPLRLRVLRTGQDTLLSHLTRLVERAQAERPRLARLADAVAARFVLALFAVAAVVAIMWSQLAPGRAFEITLAVLIVSCPCALSLSIPAALAAAHARLARSGVLVLRPDALDTLARADTVVLDKTGTLTAGRFRLHGLIPLHGFDGRRALAIAAGLERGSAHPIARAFAGLDATAASEVRIVPGDGVEGIVDGVRYRLGRIDFAGAQPCRSGPPDPTADGLWLGDGERLLARFDVGDEPRTDAGAACDALRTLGLDLEVLSGDGDAAVAAIGRRLGIDRLRARQRPEDKLARVRALQAGGHVVAMLGDGINDAPVLAGADVSIALAAGAPTAHRAADLVLMGDSLARMPETIAVARQARRIVRQNLAWAVGYNLVALPVAALGLVTPWLAALGMAASSLLVTGNALRLARTGRRRSESAAAATPKALASRIRGQDAWSLPA